MDTPPAMDAPVGDGACGHANEPCCTVGQLCADGQTCHGNVCVACGSMGMPC